MAKRPRSHLERYPWFYTVRAKAPARGFAHFLFSLSIVAIFALIMAGVWYFLHWAIPDRLSVGGDILWLAIMGFILCYSLYRGIIEAAQPDGFDLLEKDARPPVVFLRSFMEDDRRVTDTRLLGGNENRELAMIESLRQLGPVVAIGKPGDVFPRLGAARLYVTHTHWQEVVISLLSHAAAVILQPDDTPGTRWEIGAAPQYADLRRILLIVPNPRLRPLAYERVRRAVAASFPSLPEAPGACDAFVFENGAPRPLYFEQDSASLISHVFARNVSALSGTNT